MKNAGRTQTNQLILDFDRRRLRFVMKIFSVDLISGRIRATRDMNGDLKSESSAQQFVDQLQ